MSKIWGNTKFQILLICLIAILLRILYAIMPGAIYRITPPFDPTEGDYFYYDKIAKAILSGEGYHQDHLYAYQPPLYPAFLALLYYLSDTNYRFVQGVQIVLSVILVLTTYLIGYYLINRRVGLLSAIMVAIYPQFIRYPSELLSETLYLALFSIAVFLLIIAKLKNKPLYFTISGMITATAALTRVTAYYFPLFVFIWLYLCKNKLRYSFLPFLLGFIIVLSPWTYRNYKIFHAFVPISTQVGVNFYSGHNPNTKPGFSWTLPPNVKPFWNKSAPSGYPKGYYELLIMRESIKQGFTYILNHPKEVIKLWIARFWLAWRPPWHKITFKKPKEAIFRLGWLIAYIFILFTFLGGVYISRHNWRFFSIFYLYILFIIFTNIITHFESRYRLPAIPFMIFFSAMFLEKIVLSWGKKKINNNYKL